MTLNIMEVSKKIVTYVKGPEIALEEVNEYYNKRVGLEVLVWGLFHYHIANKEANLCTICLRKINKPVRLECGHIFDKDCILPWIEQKNSCPKDGKVIHPFLNVYLRDINPIEIQFAEMLQSYRLQLKKNDTEWFEEGQIALNEIYAQLEDLAKKYPYLEERLPYWV